MIARTTGRALSQVKHQIPCLGFLLQALEIGSHHHPRAGVVAK
jgi:hypothetical protein